ncbi:hypothetical protein H9P43_001983 [Blastocladiella emersonii ATCC 22665]|nr:hypothetical protein H9P43_001983 [Blastocladiella emersonii ATCC 22665]
MAPVPHHPPPPPPPAQAAQAQAMAAQQQGQAPSAAKANIDNILAQLTELEVSFKQEMEPQDELDAANRADAAALAQYLPTGLNRSGSISSDARHRTQTAPEPSRKQGGDTDDEDLSPNSLQRKRSLSSAIAATKPGTAPAAINTADSIVRRGLETARRGSTPATPISVSTAAVRSTASGPASPRRASSPLVQAAPYQRGPLKVDTVRNQQAAAAARPTFQPNLSTDIDLSESRAPGSRDDDDASPPVSPRGSLAAMRKVTQLRSQFDPPAATTTAAARGPIRVAPPPPAPPSDDGSVGDDVPPASPNPSGKVRSLKSMFEAPAAAATSSSSSSSAAYETARRGTFSTHRRSPSNSASSSATAASTPSLAPSPAPAPATAPVPAPISTTAQPAPSPAGTIRSTYSPRTATLIRQHQQQHPASPTPTPSSAASTINRSSAASSLSGSSNHSSMSRSTHSSMSRDGGAPIISPRYLLPDVIPIDPPPLSPEPASPVHPPPVVIAAQPAPEEEVTENEVADGGTLDAIPPPPVLQNHHIPGTLLRDMVPISPSSPSSDGSGEDGDGGHWHSIASTVMSDTAPGNGISPTGSAEYPSGKRVSWSSDTFNYAMPTHHHQPPAAAPAPASMPVPASARPTTGGARLAGARPARTAPPAVNTTRAADASDLEIGALDWDCEQTLALGSAASTMLRPGIRVSHSPVPRSPVIVSPPSPGGIGAAAANGSAGQSLSSLYDNLVHEADVVLSRRPSHTGAGIGVGDPGNDETPLPSMPASRKGSTSVTAQLVVELPSLTNLFRHLDLDLDDDPSPPPPPSASSPASGGSPNPGGAAAGGRRQYAGLSRFAEPSTSPKQLSPGSSSPGSPAGRQHRSGSSPSVHGPRLAIGPSAMASVGQQHRAAARLRGMSLPQNSLNPTAQILEAAGPAARAAAMGVIHSASNLESVPMSPEVEADEPELVAAAPAKPAATVAAVPAPPVAAKPVEAAAAKKQPAPAPKPAPAPVIPTKVTVNPTPAPRAPASDTSSSYSPASATSSFSPSAASSSSPSTSSPQSTVSPATAQGFTGRQTLVFEDMRLDDLVEVQALAEQLDALWNSDDATSANAFRLSTLFRPTVVADESSSSPAGTPPPSMPLLPDPLAIPATPPQKPVIEAAAPVAAVKQPDASAAAAMARTGSVSLGKSAAEKAELMRRAEEKRAAERAAAAVAETPGIATDPRVTRALARLAAAQVQKVAVRVYIHDAAMFKTVEVTSVMSAGVVAEAVVERAMLDNRHGQWTLFELFHDIGVERPLRDWERVTEVLRTWERDTRNVLLIRRYGYRDSLTLDALKVFYPVLRDWIHYETKPGTFKKRLFELRTGAPSEPGVRTSRDAAAAAGLYMATGEDKQFVLLCNLTHYDVYTPIGNPKKKAPTKFSFSLKSQQRMSTFEDANDGFVFHFYAPTMEKMKEWVLALRNARAHLDRILRPEWLIPPEQALLGAEFPVAPESAAATAAAAAAAAAAGPQKPLLDFNLPTQPLLVPSASGTASTFASLARKLSEKDLPATPPLAAADDTAKPRSGEMSRSGSMPLGPGETLMDKIDHARSMPSLMSILHRSKHHHGTSQRQQSGSTLVSMIPGGTTARQAGP